MYILFTLVLCILHMCNFVLLRFFIYIVLHMSAHQNSQLILPIYIFMLNVCHSFIMMLYDTVCLINAKVVYART